MSIFHSIDMPQIAPLAVVVEPVAHDEVVGDFKAVIGDVEVYLKVAGLNEQCRDKHALGVVVFEQQEEFLHGETRVDDVFHDDHRAALNRFVKADELAHLSRGACALVRRHAHEGNFARHADSAQQVGCKNERAVEHGEEKRLFAGEVGADLCAEGSHALLDFFFGNADGEAAVFDFDGFHVISI